uniref:Uncharacterized protein n=1 Tax=Anguilla anguilla TaxID=7936 RepID=A0A0E9TWU8_ANGAN
MGRIFLSTSHPELYTMVKHSYNTHDIYSTIC